MRTAINIGPRMRSYQAGGAVEYDPLNPPGPFAASPVQPAPGAAGVTSPPIPPPTAPQGDQPWMTDQLPSPLTGPAPAPTPAPPAAIQTTPTAPTQPSTGQLDEHDVDLQAADDNENQRWKTVGSVRGDNRFLSPKPEPIDPKQEPEYQRLLEMRSRLAELQKSDTSKGQQWFKRAENDYKYQVRKYDADVKQRDKQALTQWQRTERDEQSKSDAKYDPSHAEQHLEAFNTGLANQQGEFDKLIQNGTPQQRQEAEMKLKSSPLTTMKPADRNLVARNLIALNPNLTPEMAADALLLVATPPPLDMKPLNKMRGKAAANYIPRNSDSLGNYVLNTPMGTIRVHPDMYKKLKQARYDGYNQRIKYQQDLQKQRDDKSGVFPWISRQIDSALGRSPTP